MCLIIASPNGKRPDADLLASAATDNPDGWGLVWYSARHRRLKARKGLHTREAARALQAIPGGAPFLLHYRWTTHGGNSIENVHPFRLGKFGYLAHNGILSVPTPDDRYSDTWHFVNHMVKPFLKQHRPSDADLVAMTEKFIGSGNKVAIIKKNGSILIANAKSGEWIDGIWYSNLNSHYSDCDSSWGWWSKRTYTPTRYTPARWRTWEQTNETALDDDVYLDFAEEQQCDACGLLTFRLFYDSESRLYTCGRC